jgi:ribosomal protein S16
MLRRVALVITDVSEARSASIIRNVGYYKSHDVEDLSARLKRPECEGEQSSHREYFLV